MSIYRPPLTGRIVDWPRTQYDADTERERSTNLKNMLDPKGPRAYYFAQSQPEREAKVDDYTKGILLHELVLEGRRTWTVYKGGRRGTNDYKAFLAENEGLTILSESEEAEILSWRDALMRNKVARKLIEAGGFREQTILWEEQAEFIADGIPTKAEVKCKAALDSLDFNGDIFCLKTTRATNRKEWEREVRKLHYDFSAAFYSRGRDSIPALANSRGRFTHVVVMKGEFPSAYAFELSADWLSIGDAKVRKCLSRLAKCRHDEERIKAEGGDILDAWPDDIEETQSDPVMPELYDYPDYEKA